MQVVQQWPVQSVLEWMAAARLEPFIDIFRARDVTGETLTSLTVAGLQVSDLWTVVTCDLWTGVIRVTGGGCGQVVLLIVFVNKNSLVIVFR